MSVPQLTGADAETKQQLRNEFPGWSIIHTRDTGRWWAMRNLERDERGKLINREISDVNADTPDQLRAKLQKAT